MTENTVVNRIAHVEKFLTGAAEKLGTKFTPAVGSNEFRLATAQEFIRTTAAKYGVKVEEIDVAGAAANIEKFLTENAGGAGAKYTTFAASLEAEAAAEAAKVNEAPAKDDGLRGLVDRLVAFAKRHGFQG